ncbi:hypothetical protein [Arcticibacter sp.]|uniref:hypothetical protein n=1 Tax=Arcticibacter sp. TaxID=1872630 RepID=UPI00388D8CA9
MKTAPNEEHTNMSPCFNQQTWTHVGVIMHGTRKDLKAGRKKPPVYLQAAKQKSAFLY